MILWHLIPLILAIYLLNHYSATRDTALPYGSCLAFLVEVSRCVLHLFSGQALLAAVEGGVAGLVGYWIWRWWRRGRRRRPSRALGVVRARLGRLVVVPVKVGAR